jgi:DinB superfamily
MPTSEEYRQLPLSARLSRLERTPDELGKMISGRNPTELAKRPDARNWSPTEIVCHLRDVEETFQARFHMIVALDEPRRPPR